MDDACAVGGGRWKQEGAPQHATQVPTAQCKLQGGRPLNQGGGGKGET